MPRDAIEQPADPPQLPIGHQRLLRLADHLDTVSPHGFSMTDGQHCAMAKACRMPEFQKEGLVAYMWSYRDAMGFFGLSVGQVDDLFGAFPRSLHQEAQYIREFVRARSVAMAATS